MIQGADWTRRQSGLYVPPKANRRYERPTCVDFFCGAGGFSLGVIQAGFQVVAACDNDPDATLTYLANLGAYPVDIHYSEPADYDRLNTVIERHGTRKHGKIDTQITSGSCRPPALPGVPHYFFGDIHKVTGAAILDAIGLERGELDLVVGGPPCQGFSKAGKRDVMDPRNSLVFEYARLILELQPKTMCMENVPGIVSMVTADGIPVVEAFIQILSDGGFASYDALRKMLGVQKSAKAVYRGAQVSKDVPKGTAVEQASLFEVPA